VNKDIILTNFENEYYTEIKDCKVKIEDLKKFGVSAKVLSSEIYLYEIYGDEIVHNENLDDLVDGAQKRVVKLGESEKSLNNEYLTICEKIENNEFDNNLEKLLIKVK
jgi:hypothetical protein